MLLADIHTNRSVFSEFSTGWSKKNYQEIKHLTRANRHGKSRAWGWEIVPAPKSELGDS